MSINDIFRFVRIVSVISNSYEIAMRRPSNGIFASSLSHSSPFKNLQIFPNCILLTDCVHRENTRVKQAKERTVLGSMTQRKKESARKSEREQRKRKKNIVLLVTRLRTQLFAHTMYKSNLCVPSTTYYLSITRDHRPLDAQVNAHNLLATKLVSRKLITAGDGKSRHEIKFPISSVFATGWHVKCIAESVICVKHHSWIDRRWHEMHLIIRFDAITHCRA